MNLLNFISGLANSFGKNDVLERCNLSKTSLIEHSIPAYTAASELFAGQKFKSKSLQDYSAIFNKNVGNKAGGGTIGAILAILTNAVSVLDVVAELSKKMYSDREANISLTYSKATLLRLIECSEFTGDYSRKFLNYIYLEEAKEADAEIDIKLSPNEEKWIDDGFFDFCLALNVLKLDVAIIRKHLAELPDASITESTERVFPSTLGYKRIDPFGFNGFSVKYYPLYRIGMFVAEWQANKYNEAKAELEQLQLQQLHLKKLQDGKPDAKLEKTIAYNQTRLSDMYFKVSKLEKEYGV